MEKDLHKSIVDPLVQQISNLEDPRANYNPNDKYIAVTYDFFLGYIPNVKIRAHRDKWVEWHKNIENINQIAPEVIINCLSRPTQKLKSDLNLYVKTDLELFFDDFSVCINAALYEHPKYPKKKPRGQSPHQKKDKKNWKKRRNKVKGQSKHLYLFLQYWFKQPTAIQPKELKACLKRHDVDKLPNPNPKDITMDIICDLFSDVVDCEHIQDPEVFYKKYIAVPSGSLSRLKKSLHRVISIDNPFLKEILFPK